MQRKTPPRVSKMASCYVRLQLSPQTDYLEFKKELTRLCRVRLERIKIKNPTVDMPPALRKKTQIPAKEQNGINESSNALCKQENFISEPPWLQDLDDLSQLLVCFLLTRETDEFVRCLLTYQKRFSFQHLHACVEVMLLMTSDDVFKALNIALQTPELESLLSSIIINLIIYAVHDDEHSSKISVLLSLVRAHDLILWSDNLTYLTSEIDSWKVCLLVVHLFTAERDLATAVDIICETDIIQKMLHAGTGFPTQMELYASVLVELMRTLYVKKKCGFVRRLLMRNLSPEKLAPQSQVWAALALGTLVANTNPHIEHVAQNVVEILKKGIKLPQSLLRSSLMRLQHSHPEIAFSIFETADTYKILIHSFPNKGPIPRIITLNVSETWAISEYQIAFLWVCKMIKKRKPNARCAFSIRPKPDDSVPEEPIVADIDFCHLLCPVEKSSAMSRLGKALKGLEPPVIGMVMENTIHVPIYSSSLRFHLG